MYSHSTTHTKSPGCSFADKCQRTVSFIVRIFGVLYSFSLQVKLPFPTHPSYSWWLLCPFHFFPFPIISDTDDKGVGAEVSTPTGSDLLVKELCLEKLWAMSTLGIKRVSYLPSSLIFMVLRRYCLILPLPKDNLPSLPQPLENLRQPEVRTWVQWLRPARIFFQSAVRKREGCQRMGLKQAWGWTWDDIEKRKEWENHLSKRNCFQAHFMPAKAILYVHDLYENSS